MALILEYGKLIRNKDNPFTFRFILAGDESQTICPSGFHWDYTQNLFTSRLGESIDTPPKRPFVNNYRNPVNIANLLNETCDLYSKYVLNKKLRPSISPSQSNADESLDYGKVILWDISDFRLDLNQLFIFLEKNYPSDCAVIDLNYNNTHKSKIVYSELEIKGLERKTIFILNITNSLKRLKKSKGQNSPIYGIRNRKIIDSLRVAISRSSNLLILVDCEPNLITQEFREITPEKLSLNEIESILEKQVDGRNFLEEITLLIHRIDEALNADDLERAEFFFDKIKIYKDLDFEGFRDLILLKEKAIFNLNKSLIEQSVRGNDFEQADFYLDHFKKRNIDSSLDFISNHNQMMLELDYKVQHQKISYSISQFSSEKLENTTRSHIENTQQEILSLREKHSKDEYYDQDSIFNLTTKTVWLELLKLISSKQFGDENSYSSYIDKSEFLDYDPEFVKVLRQSNFNTLEELSKKLWKITEKYRSNNLLNEDLNDVRKYIKILKIIRDIRSQHQNIWDFIIDGYESFYPLDNCHLKFTNFLHYINEHFTEKFENDNNLQDKLEPLKSLSIHIWLDNIRDVFNNISIDNEFFDVFLNQDNLKILREINLKYPDHAIKIDEKIFEKFKDNLSLRDLVNIFRINESQNLNMETEAPEAIQNALLSLDRLDKIAQDFSQLSLDEILSFQSELDHTVFEIKKTIENLINKRMF
ncbi:hypothetical protein [Picosynechococcus sp. PCC 7117]|uniref:hypothetical protein n=1 Tax=Picosynechococcus sp. PCC 7117 TaxID=195498 RepID=UPI00081082CE|nr:hypothetical protein [Picosynechococcus sp. PCC 7117]ANV88928.1 hypothetical protein AWQ22_15070 [Picosynechococcus sp. PCC 7117]